MNQRMRALLGLLLLLALANAWRYRAGRAEPAGALQGLPASLQAPAPVGPRADLFNFGSAGSASVRHRPGGPKITPTVAAEAVAVPTPEAAAWRLLGLALRGEVRSALFQPAAGGPTKMAIPGQALDEVWTLESIENDKAVLRRSDGSRLELPMLGAP
jgi:hypothetical protein